MRIIDAHLLDICPCTDTNDAMAFLSSLDELVCMPLD